MQITSKQIDETLIADTMHRCQLMQANYENRLKADMVAILTDIQLEIEEKSIIDYDEDLYDGGECVISISEINEIIQEKINSLKEAQNDREKDI